MLEQWRAAGAAFARAGRAAAHRRMKTLLFVDPEPGIRGLLHAIFAGRYRVLEAEDGESALGLICIERPDLVLFELELPDLPGLEMCRLVKSDQQFRSTRLVALTTAVDPASRM